MLSHHVPCIHRAYLSVVEFSSVNRIMSDSSFGGLWSYPSIAHTKHKDFMIIDEERRRIITFVIITDDPSKRVPLRNWYRPVSATSISVRLRSIDPWRDHDFRLEGDCLGWTFGGEVHTWRRVPWEERPEWLDSRLVTENSKMDAAEECG